VAPCNDVGKYFYTGAHLQYMGYKAVVEVFFHLASEWSKWCTQTLHPFSRILTIFPRIGAPFVAPSSDNLQICSLSWKGIFFPEKTLQTGSKSACFNLLLKQCDSVAGNVNRRSVINEQIKKSEKHHISSSHANVRRAISTKFCMVIGGPCHHFRSKTFLAPIHSFSARGRRKFG